MTRVIEMTATQHPFDLGTDESGRAMFACNYRARIGGASGDWPREVIKVLSDAGLATEGVNAWKGSKMVLPAGDGPFIRVLLTSGLASEEAHGGERTERPSVQIIVTAKSYTTAESRALAIWRVLDGKRGFTVTV